MNRVNTWMLLSTLIYSGFLYAEPAVSEGQRSVAKTIKDSKESADHPPLKTEQWLHIQTSGRYATPHTQTATLVEQELANQRLLDSYSHPIPEFFDEDIGGELDD